MIDLLGILFYGLALIATIFVSIPILFFFLQIIASLRLKVNPKPIMRYVRRPSIAVIIPAHNESAGIKATLESILPQMNTYDRLLVIADNCSDNTVQVARSAGATAIERTDLERRGKGFALDYGIRFLEKNPPDVIVIIDADCTLHPGSLDALASEVIDKKRPVQGLYLMNLSANRSLSMRIAVFAWRIKNLIRPLGMKSLGVSSQLMGTGMAFPWDLIQSAQLASGHLAEDMQLGIEFALRGKGVIFVPEALVTSQFPDTHEDANQQRTRWIHGHLDVLFNMGPKLLKKSIETRSWRYFLLGLDLMIPPLGILLMMIGAQFVFALFTVLFTGWMGPFFLSLGTIFLFAISGFICWEKYCRDVISLADLTAIPFIIAKRIPIYIGFWTKKKLAWVRTKRNGE